MSEISCHLKEVLFILTYGIFHVRLRIFCREFYSKPSSSRFKFQLLKLLKTLTRWNAFEICYLHKERTCISQLTHYILQKIFYCYNNVLLCLDFGLLLIIVLLYCLKRPFSILHVYIHSHYSMYMLPFQSPNLNFKTH